MAANSSKKALPEAVNEDLVHRVRFAFLGYSQERSAEIIDIGPRGWRYIRNGKRAFSHHLGERTEVAIMVHRPSPVPLLNSPEAKLCELSVKRARSLNELQETRQCFDKLGEIEDYGIAGLAGSVSFAAWYLSFTRELHAPPTHLRNAINYWEKAAEKAPMLAKKVFNINARTARIYDETFFKGNGKPQPSTNHHCAYREYAMTFNSVQAWRDSLEQAALLGNHSKIKLDFKSLRDAARSANISVKDAYEVILRELERIDGFSFLNELSEFQSWSKKLKYRYNIAYQKVAA